MKFSCNTLTTHMERDELMSLTDAEPFEITSQVGCLWVTIDNDTRDIILEPGQRHEFAPGDRALIVALKPSWFLISKALAQAAPRQPAASSWSLAGALRRLLPKPSSAPATA
jgi:Protein of unknown function (DUF2917)